MPTDWLDSLDTALAESSGSTAAAGRIRQRSMVATQQVSRNLSDMRSQAGIVVPPMQMVREAEALAPATLAPDIATAQAEGADRGFMGGVGASFVDPGVSMLTMTGDEDALRVNAERQAAAAREGVMAKLGRGVGTTAQVAPMLMTGAAPAGLATRVLSQLPVAAPIATGSALEVAQANPVAEHGMELAGRIAQAAALGASRQTGMMIGGSVGPKVSAVLAGPKAGLTRAAAAETASLPAMSAGMTAAQIPGELAFAPDGVENVKQMVDPEQFGTSMLEFASQVPVGLATRRMGVNQMRAQADRRRVDPERLGRIALAEADRVEQGVQRRAATEAEMRSPAEADQQALADMAGADALAAREAEAVAAAQRQASEAGVRARREAELTRLREEQATLEADPFGRKAVEDAAFLDSEIARFEKTAAQAGGLGRAAEYQEAIKGREAAMQQAKVARVEAQRYQKRVAANAAKRAALERRLTPAAPEAIPGPPAESAPVTRAAADPAQGKPLAGFAAPETSIPAKPAAPGGVETDPIRRRLAEIDVERSEIGQRTAELRKQGSETDAGRAAVDAEFARLHTGAKDGVSKALLAGSTAEQKASAVTMASEAVRVAEERVKVAQAKLDAMSSAESDVGPATVSLREAQRDLDLARATKVEADNVVKSTRRDASQGRVDAVTNEKRDHAERLRGDVETGLRRSMGPQLAVEVTPEGNLRAHADGKHIVDLVVDVEPHRLVADDFPNWWESMGGREGVRRWLNLQGVTAEARSGKSAKAMLGGALPREVDGSDLVNRLPPGELVKFMAKYPVHASYERGSGRIRLHANQTSNEIAAQAASHEGNHRVTHAIMLAAVRSPEMAQHLDILVRATGIDPRNKPAQTVRFLEEVQRRFAEWRKTYNPEATKIREGADRARSESPFRRAMSALFDRIAALAKWFGVGGKDKPTADLAPLFRDMAEGKFLGESVTPSTAGEKAFATRDESVSPPPSLRERMAENPVGRAITRTGDWAVGKAKDVVETAVGVSKSVAKKLDSVAQSLTSEESEIRRVDAIRERLKTQNPDLYKRIMDEGPMFATQGVDEDSPRRARATAEDPSNLSMGGVDPENRPVVAKIRAFYEKKEGTTEARIVKAEAAKVIGEKGIKTAVSDALAKAREYRTSDAATADNTSVAVLETRVNQLMDQYRTTGTFQGTEMHTIVAAIAELKGKMGAALSLNRDAFETPAQRAETVQRAFWRQSEHERMWFRRQGRRIVKAKESGDAAGERLAKQVFDSAMERFMASKERQLKKMKKWGVDLADVDSLTKALDGDTFATVIKDIDDVALMAKDDASWMDWLQANHRAHLLGDPLTTQSQQILSNALSAIENVGFNAIKNPRVLFTAIRSGAISSAMQNVAASWKEGRNAWVHKISGEELGRFEDHYRPTDNYSKFARAISFDLMAAIDGGFQRFNAQLAAAGLSYRQARANGRSRSDAIADTRAALESGLSGDLALEAMFRSLPQTFQELSLTRPGEDRVGLDKVIGKTTEALSEFDDMIGRGTMGLFGRSKVTGEALPVPISKIALPFVRTPIAIARAAARRNFLGSASVLSAAAKLWKIKNAGGLDAEVDLAREQLQRRVFESVVVGGLAMHMLAATLDVTGTNVDDEEASRTGRGKGEKTIALFGKRFAYSRLEPFATPLAMAADGLKAIREGRNPATAELEALLKLGSDLAWFRLIAGVGQTVQNIKAGRGDVVESTASGVGEWAGKTAVTMTPGVGLGAVRAALKPADELSRKVEHGFMGGVKGEVGLNQITNRDVWGRKVMRGPDLGTDTPVGDPVGRALAGGTGRTPDYRPTDVDRWLEDRGVQVPAWAARDEDGEMYTPDQASAFIEKAGPRLLEAIRAIKASRPNIPPELLKKAITARKRSIGRAVRREMSRG